MGAQLSRRSPVKQVLYAFFCLLFLATTVNAQTNSTISKPPNLSSSVYTGSISSVKHSAPQPSKVLSGPVQVGIKLQDPPLVVAVGANAKQNGITMTADQQ